MEVLLQVILAPKDDCFLTIKGKGDDRLGGRRVLFAVKECLLTT